MKTDTIGILVQARMGSTRLPGKMMKPFYDGKGILELLIERLSLSVTDYKIVVCTSETPKDDVIAQLCQKMGVDCFRGSEHNVLQRFVDCSKANGFQDIIRICADNPFLSIELLEELLAESQRSPDKEYIGYKINNGQPAIKSHFGFFCEFVKVSALEKITKHTQDGFYFEHVTNFIYEHENLFKVHFIPAPIYIINNPDIRLTIDNASDFEIAKELCGQQLKKGSLAIKEIIKQIERNPDIMDQMRINIETNAK